MEECLDLLYGLLKVNDQQSRTNIHTLCGYITPITYKPNVHISLLKYEYDAYYKGDESLAVVVVGLY